MPAKKWVLVLSFILPLTGAFSSASNGGYASTAPEESMQVKPEVFPQPQTDSEEPIPPLASTQPSPQLAQARLEAFQGFLYSFPPYALKWSFRTSAKRASECARGQGWLWSQAQQESPQGRRVRKLRLEWGPTEAHPTHRAWLWQEESGIYQGWQQEGDHPPVPWEATKPFSAGFPYSPMDLLMGFVHWPARYVKAARVLRRPCYLFELHPARADPPAPLIVEAPESQAAKEASVVPSPTPVQASWAKALMYLDAAFDVLLKIEFYNPLGQKNRQLSLQGFRKIGSAWWPSALQVKHWATPGQAPQSSYFRVLDALEYNPPKDWFTPPRIQPSEPGLPESLAPRASVGAEPSLENPLRAPHLLPPQEPPPEQEAGGPAPGEASLAHQSTATN